jgi:lipopolysaccharide export system permease protein
VIIFRYFSKELYSHVMGMILILLIIFTTNQFVHFVKEVANGVMTMPAVFKIMSLQVPLLLGYLLPLSLYLSVIIVLGRFYMNNEMTVLFACGFSKSKLVWMVMTFAFAVMLVVAWLMIWIEPLAEDYQFKTINESIALASVAKLMPQQFQMLGSKGTFYTQHLNRGQQTMEKVFLALKKDSAVKGAPPIWDITIAERAGEKKQAKAGHRFLVLENGSRYIGSSGQNNFQKMTFDQYGIALVNEKLRIHGWPFNVPTSELWPLRNKNLKANATLQWRIAMPISVLIFPLLAVPLSRVNPRRGRFMQLFPAILIYSTYADLLFLGRSWIQSGVVSPLIGLWWVHGLALGLAVILLYFYLRK